MRPSPTSPTFGSRRPSAPLLGTQLTPVRFVAGEGSAMKVGTTRAVAHAASGVSGCFPFPEHPGFHILGVDTGKTKRTAAKQRHDPALLSRRGGMQPPSTTASSSEHSDGEQAASHPPQKLAAWSASDTLMTGLCGRLPDLPPCG